MGQTFEGALNHSAGFVGTAGFDENAGARFDGTGRLRLLGAGLVEQLQRTAGVAFVLVNPCQLDQRRSVVGTATHQLFEDILCALVIAEGAAGLGEREAQAGVVRIALHRCAEQIEGARGIGTALSVVQQKVGGGFKNIGVAGKQSAPSSHDLLRFAHAETVDQQAHHLQRMGQVAGIPQIDGFDAGPKIAPLGVG